MQVGSKKKKIIIIQHACSSNLWMKTPRLWVIADLNFTKVKTCIDVASYDTYALDKIDCWIWLRSFRCSRSMLSFLEQVPRFMCFWSHLHQTSCLVGASYKTYALDNLSLLHVYNFIMDTPSHMKQNLVRKFNVLLC